mmetsp:Transcript_2958/g.4489  ORF Transcript_2958/g.4489 Transcript_2958/m.4489 type:complete len:175 (+) Transcript_2958:101-625(+)|eukprot:CAMPEP_0185032548 /NCGR_PEP_ID=MMETSP1103-20130426/20706_1 /TAXON_ID=36769 /ORGANISM="Paraphysomonas bandaiensis, Strain Caron Lab Isolate" /LENGTH=174 /DNA_ID=CAMNT_0027568491 /DNA_START=85 /DNA_END=609 /DNA_ORIENTATION=+
MEFSISGNAISTSTTSLPKTETKLPYITDTRRPSSKSKPETSPRILGSKNHNSAAVIRRNSGPNQKSLERSHSRGDSKEGRPPVAVGATNYRKPTKMQRAKSWSPEVENLFRYQAAGFMDSVEYGCAYPPPELWEQSGFVKCLQVKKNGYFMYFRQDRECHDKYLNKTKIYTYS